mmetsp:Transcript_96485/g.277776  ORF Transcript_96485/g.277776 Transcript_96485/m.277776 type:complete len:241 (-) Transcript_96485:1988-2710(-)
MASSSGSRVRAEGSRQGVRAGASVATFASLRCAGDLRRHLFPDIADDLAQLRARHLFGSGSAIVRASGPDCAGHRRLDMADILVAKLGWCFRRVSECWRMEAVSMQYDLLRITRCYNSRPRSVGRVGHGGRRSSSPTAPLALHCDRGCVRYGGRMLVDAVHAQRPQQHWPVKLVFPCAGGRCRRRAWRGCLHRRPQSEASDALQLVRIHARGSCRTGMREVARLSLSFMALHLRGPLGHW